MECTPMNRGVHAEMQASSTAYGGGDGTKQNINIWYQMLKSLTQDTNIWNQLLKSGRFGWKPIL